MHTHTYRPHARLAPCMSSDYGSGHATGMFKASLTLPRSFQAKCLAAPGVPQRNGGGGVDGEHHTKHLPGQPAQLHNPWLHLPHRRRSRDALQQAPGRMARKVRLTITELTRAVQFRPLTLHDF